MITNNPNLFVTNLTVQLDFFMKGALQCFFFYSMFSGQLTYSSYYIFHIPLSHKLNQVYVIHLFLSERYLLNGIGVNLVLITFFPFSLTYICRAGAIRSDDCCIVQKVSFLG